MIESLPLTPAENLDISTWKLRLKTSVMVALAELFGFWKHPVKTAAAAVEEMTRNDIYYWVYKSKRPIQRWESGETVSPTLQRDVSEITLPQGFLKQSTVTMGSVGDLFRSRGIADSEDILYEKIADLLFDQDISYANFESPITDQPLVEEVISDTAPPTECCSRKQFDVLKGHKGKLFNVLNTCNNHAFDMGVEGLDTTHEVLAQHDILNVGVNQAADDYGKAQILTKQGVKIGFVSATFGLNGRQLSETEAHRINVSQLSSKFAEPDLALLKQQIDHCHAERCDFIVASMHWGFEFECFPRERQVIAARALAEYGADAIICHHPHVIQPVEYYQTQRDPNRSVVIAYSLGSLVWGFKAPHLVLAAILNLTLAKGLYEGQVRTYIESACVTPVFRSVTAAADKTITRIEKLDDYINKSDADHTQGYLKEIKRYASLVLG